MGSPVSDGSFHTRKQGLKACLSQTANRAFVNPTIAASAPRVRTCYVRGDMVGENVL